MKVLLLLLAVQNDLCGLVDRLGAGDVEARRALFARLEDPALKAELERVEGTSTAERAARIGALLSWLRPARSAEGVEARLSAAPRADGTVTLRVDLTHRGEQAIQTADPAHGNPWTFFMVEAVRPDGTVAVLRVRQAGEPARVDALTPAKLAFEPGTTMRYPEGIGEALAPGRHALRVTVGTMLAAKGYEGRSGTPLNGARGASSIVFVTIPAVTR